MNYKYIVWDWNGTLFDDVQISVDAVNYMLEKTGYKNRVDVKLYKEIFRFPVSDYYISAGFDFAKHSFDELAKIYVYIYTKLQYTANLNKEAKEVLRKLNSLGVNQIIVSACEKNRLKNQIAKFKIADEFAEILGIDDDYAVGKVDIAKKWFAQNNIDAKEVLFVGDTDHDLEVANAVGCDCVFVSFGHQSKERLSKFNIPILDSLNEVADYILS